MVISARNEYAPVMIERSDYVDIIPTLWRRDLCILDLPQYITVFHIDADDIVSCYRDNQLLAASLNNYRRYIPARIIEALAGPNSLAGVLIESYNCCLPSARCVDNLVINDKRRFCNTPGAMSALEFVKSLDGPFDVAGGIKANDLTDS